MKRLVSAILAALLSATLLAQGDRITFRTAPAPDQTFHVHSTQEVAMTTGLEAPTPDPSTPVVLVSFVFDSTAAIGPRDADGHYAARMTIDRVSTTATLNGNPMPLPLLPDEANKRVMVFSYDQEGKVIDVTIDGGPAGTTIDRIKELLAQVMGAAAPMTLSVGETVTVPGTLNLPIGGGTNQMGLSTETRFTLTGITLEGTDRIAHLATRTESTLAPNPDAASTGLTGFSMTMSGDGRTDVNVDRGILVHNEQHLTLDGSIRGGSGDAAKTMSIHGTFNAATDLVK